jgi:hypothetical protein
MEESEMMKILGYDPMAAENTFEKVMADLKAKDLTAGQLSNGIHLDLASLVDKKRISRKESAVLHVMFLEKE